MSFFQSRLVSIFTTSVQLSMTRLPHVCSVPQSTFPFLSPAQLLSYIYYATLHFIPLDTLVLTGVQFSADDLSGDVLQR